MNFLIKNTLPFLFIITCLLHTAKDVNAQGSLQFNQVINLCDTIPFDTLVEIASVPEGKAWKVVYASSALFTTSGTVSWVSPDSNPSNQNPHGARIARLSPNYEINPQNIWLSEEFKILLYATPSTQSLVATSYFFSIIEFNIIPQ